MSGEKRKQGERRKTRETQEGDANAKQLLSHLNPEFFWLLRIPGAARDPPVLRRPRGVGGRAGKTRLPKGDGDERKITFMLFTVGFSWLS